MMEGKRSCPRAAKAVLLLVAVTGITCILAALVVLGPAHWLIRGDLYGYHLKSAWATGEGTLYGDIPSEYPLAANLLFAACRVPAGADFGTYALLWMSAAWLAYVGVGYLIATRVGWEALALWLAPGAAYFAAVRFDVYPAAATLLAFLAFRGGRPLRGSLWFGLAIALKGYALFMLPAVLVFVLRNRGWRTALAAAALCLGPMVVANLAVLSYAGPDGMLSPYRFHARRANFGESSYDALYYLTAFLFDGPPVVGGPVPGLLAAGCALGAAALRPKSFAELVRAALAGLLGFISFSPFYSPQYVLWLLPLAVFVTDRRVRWLAIAYGWLTFFYYPVFHVSNAETITLASAAAQGGAALLIAFRGCVVGVTLLRGAIVLLLLAPARPPSGAGGPRGGGRTAGRAAAAPLPAVASP